ncbi:MAG: PAS domain-containing protein [Methanobacterium sp.]|nr:PAS domain-containing protein [Methanobacterium sp.]
MLLKDMKKSILNLFTLTPAGMAITTIDGKIIEANSAYANITGY